MRNTIKRLRLNKKGISNVIVVVLSLILVVIIVANVVLWSYQMNQFDWEKMQEKIAVPEARSIRETRSFNPSSFTLGGSTSWIFGNTTDLLSDNNVCMTFRSYYSGFDMYRFVDNNVSNVDSILNKGTHSNFPAQKAGPDSIFDTLSEENTNSITFKQVSVESEQSTTYTAWTDVPGAEVSFTPKSPLEEWMIFVTADIRSSSTFENRARFRYSINGSSRGETGVQQGTTSTIPVSPLNVYFHFTRITATVSQQVVKFQFQASTGSTAYATNIHILCIRLDAAHLEYAEVNGDTLITGSQTLATLQFTPSSSGDYIIAYCALVSELPIAPGGAETWLDYDSGAALCPVAWSTPNTRRIHSDRSQFEPHCVFTKIALTAAQHSFRAQARLRTAGETSTARDVRIAAFRVDAFDLLEYDEDTGIGSTNAANTVRSVVNTAAPTESRDYLILAGIHTISSGTTSREAGGIEINDVVVQNKADLRLALVDIARIASHYAFVKTSSAGFKVETTFGTAGTGFDTVYSKQSVIYVLKLPENYQLDLETQWTNITRIPQNAELCIFGGNIAPEGIQVQAWNGSTWTNVINNLSNGWNNASVSSLLASPTFTIRFIDASRIGDTLQDSWQIDATILHLWTIEYTSEVEFSGPGNGETWRQLNWTINSAWTADSVNVTLQLYNYSLGGFPTSGEGFIVYVSSETSNTHENKSQTIDASPSDFRNSTGQWRLRVRGVKTTSVPFDLKVDWIELRAENNAGTQFTFKNGGPSTCHLVSLWIINSTYHQRHNMNLFISSGETITYTRSDIGLPDEPYLVKVITERGNAAVLSSEES